MKSSFLLVIIFLFLFHCEKIWSQEVEWYECLGQSISTQWNQVQSAFTSAKEIALDTTVRLERNGKLIALGTIINPNGFILTKASACVGAREAILCNGNSYGLKIRKRFEDIDLALYELISDKKNFSFVNWDDSNQSNCTHGFFLLTSKSKK